MGSKSKSKTTINKLLKQASNLAVPEAKEWFFGMKDQDFISPERKHAMDTMRNIAMTSSIPTDALNEYTKTVSGDYLREGNPYLDENIRRAVSGAVAAPASAYAQHGRFGSGAMANAQMDSGMAVEARMRGDNYEAERARMMQALGMTNQMDQAQYSNAQVLVDLAREQENLAPTALAQFMGLLTMNPLMKESTTKTQTTDYGQIASGVGGALLG